MSRFDGKAALLTGAASGIGRAVALRLAGEGASVFGIDVDAGGLDAVAEEARAVGGTMHTQTADVSSVADCRQAADDCASAFGRIDVLGNIAGVSWQEHFGDATEEGWDAMFGVNVKGPFFLAQAALPRLLESGGNIVNIASNTAVMGMAYTAAYGATKGAVALFTKALAMELIKTPVRVNAIAPGGVDTPMTRNFSMPDDTDFDLIRPGISPRGMSTPEQIAAVFAFVASDEAANVHGAVISADHGLTAG